MSQTEEKLNTEVRLTLLVLRPFVQEVNALLGGLSPFKHFAKACHIELLIRVIVTAAFYFCSQK
jgi:hypothetical protein